MGVTTTLINKPFSPRGNDQSPLAYNRAKLYSGKALSFDGVNDDIQISSFSTTGSTRSLSYYFKSSVSDNERVLSIRSGSNSFNSTILNGKVNTFDGVNGINTTKTFNDNKWHHVVITHNGNNNAAIYVDGVSQELDASTFSVHDITNQTLYICSESGTAQFYTGGLSNVRLFDVALTAAQVSDLYNNPEKVVPTGVDNTALKLWLPMMEGAGTTAYDGSGNGNHGTISGATYVNGIGAPVSQSAVISWNKASNLVAYSEEFDQWTAGNSSVTANDTTAPDGQTTADKWKPNSTVTGADIRRTTQSVVSGNDYVFYVFAKAGGFDQIQLDYQNSRFSDTLASFDLTNGTLGSLGGDNVTEGIIDKGDGWYLCYVVGNCIASGSNSIIIRQNGGTGDGSKGYYLWGAGFAQASDIVPYVRTSNVVQGSAVLLPQGLTTGRDITGVNLFENVRKQGALNLDGNSWAEVHDNASLDITDAITLEAWVYWDGVTTNAGILGRWFTGATSYMIYVSTGTQALFFINTSSTAATISGTGWKHIVGTYDSTIRRIYVDGQEIGSGDAYTSPIATNDKPIEVGRYAGDMSGAKSVKEQIAQPRIYNRALTAEEVQRSYDSGKNIYTNS